MSNLVVHNLKREKLELEIDLGSNKNLKGNIIKAYGNLEDNKANIQGNIDNVIMDEEDSLIIIE